MTAKRKTAASMRAPPMAIECHFEAPLFLTSDLANLAAAAELPLSSEYQHRTLVRHLHWAFAKAHQEACIAKKKMSRKFSKCWIP
jgi:hypothetical protein